MKLQLGATLNWGPICFEVIALDARVVLLRAIDDGFTREALISELYRTPEIQWCHHALKSPSVSQLAALDQLTPDQRRVVDAWLPRIKRLDDAAGPTRGHERRTAEIVREIVSELQAEGISVDPRTVWRKLDGYRERGVFGLLDGRLTHRPRPERRDPRVLEAVAEASADATGQATGTFSRIARRAIWTLKERYPDDPTLKIPAEKTLVRWISQRPNAHRYVESAKTRQSLANSPDREHETHGEWGPGEHVQIDTTPLDLLVRTPEGRTARPELTIMLDVATRTIISAVVCLDGTHSAILATVLARALVPYGLRPPGARQTRELVSTAWAESAEITQEELDEYRLRQPYIRPTTITTDNGKIFTSRAFKDACERLEISLINAAVYTPTDKAHVERTFKSIAADFSQHVRTYLGRSVEHRGVDQPIEYAPTLQQLQELLDDWVSISWQNRPHDGLRDPLRPARKLTPNEMFEHYRRLIPEVHIPFTARDYIGLLPVETRVLHPYGIRNEHRVYSSRRLGEVRAAMQTKADRRKRIRVDPFNVFTVWLEHGDEFIPLKWRTTVGIAPLGANMRQLMRESDQGARVDSRTGEISLALQEGLWRGSFGDPAAAVVSSDEVEDLTDDEPDEENVGGFRRTGDTRYFDDIDPEEEQWHAAGGFSPFVEDGNELKERLDD